ncbi:hypothetical protein F5141DRAFT_355180 [Pisolithus sp. B1]|nr:hypothetical protein F5141DRAFT_355180 [Pisolithus sp. B1]
MRKPLGTLMNYVRFAMIIPWIPVQLGCGHTYCSACLRHFVTSAHEINVFPLRCVGDDSRCNTPISIPTVQQFLTPAAFDRLLEAAFAFHISQRPMEFRFCKTPDCGQIYRSTPAGEVAVTLRCPSCSSEVCSACDDGHEGLTCGRIPDPQVGATRGHLDY